MQEETKLSDELKQMEYEPLETIEKKLIGYSIGLGLLLLIVLFYISYNYFPAV